MMTMTELFYGPVEPTWIVHPRVPGSYERPNENCYRNPYAIYRDDTLRRNAYVQRNAVPYTMVAQEGAHGMMYPGHQARLGGTHAAIAPAVHQVVAGQSPAIHVTQQNPARSCVLQPRNVVANVQTVHFMVPLCCGKCEDKVKDQLLDLDDVQRVTCDQLKQKVTVTSSVAPEKLLKQVQKIKKRSTFWPQQQQAGALDVSNNSQVLLRTNQTTTVNDENVPHQLSSMI